MRAGARRAKAVVRRLQERPSSKVTAALEVDPARVLFTRFVEMVLAGQPAAALEIGSRARSGNVSRGWLPEACTYTGFDVLDGPNVDVVGDAHHLSESVAPNSIDVVWSFSTFEHLAMPWVVAVEIGRVLRPGGLVFVGTHQTYPVHDEPWDFYRFSKYAWGTLFHEHSGFEVVAAEMGEPAAIRARLPHGPTRNLDKADGYLNSAVIARKTGSSSLRWDVPLEAVYGGGLYPSTTSGS